MNTELAIIHAAVKESFIALKKCNKRRDGVHKLHIESIENFVIKFGLQKKIKWEDVKNMLIENGYTHKIAKMKNGKMARCWVKPFMYSDSVWL